MPRGWPANKTPYIYFAQATRGGPIKIGSSTNPTRRLAYLSAAMPYDELRALLVLPEVGFMERALHYKFKHVRIKGEWFEDCAEIRETIAELAEAEKAA